MKMRKGLELVFVYVSEVNYNSYKVGLNFSNDKEFVYNEEDNNITFTNIKTSVAVNFFGNNIYNISALIGPNGVGKTSIMNILGLSQEYRKKSSKIKMIDAKYVILFFDRKNEKFYYENYLKSSDNISNIRLANCDVENCTISIDTEQVSENPIVLILSNNNNSLESEVGSDGIVRSSFGESFKIDMFDFLYLVNANQEFVYNKVFFKKKEQNRSMILIMNTLDIKPFQLPSTSKLYEQGQKVLDCFQLRKSENRELSFAKRMLNNMILSFFKLEFEMYFDEENEVDPKPFRIGKHYIERDNTRNEDKTKLEHFYKNICNHVNYLNKWQDANRCGAIKLLYKMLKFCEIQNRKKFILLLSEVLLILDEIEEDFIYIKHNDINRVCINIDGSNRKSLRKIAEYIDCYDELLYGLINKKIIMNAVIFFDFLGLSSGEQALVNQFASLNTKIQKVVKKLPSSNINEVTTIIIILDEYELHLHPEWSRVYLQHLTQLLDYYDAKKNIAFQVILTTHSPYLISDLPKENIILLEKDENADKRTARKSNYGFASNYYDIMSDNFFLDDTIGEFAKQKINGCIQTINRISDDLDKLANKELILNGDELFLFVKESLENIEGQKQIINIVGDDVIRKQLWNMSDVVEQRLLESDESQNNKERLRKRRSELAKQMAQIDQELESYD